MNFFQRLFSLFRKPKQQQPAAQVPVAPSVGPVVEAPHASGGFGPPAPAATAPPVWRVHGKTIRYANGVYMVVENNMPFRTIAEATAFCNAVSTPEEVDAYNATLKSDPFVGPFRLSDPTPEDGAWVYSHMFPVWGQPPMRLIFGGCTLPEYNTWINTVAYTHGGAQPYGDGFAYRSPFADFVREMARQRGITV